MDTKERELVDLDRFFRDSDETLQFWADRWGVSVGFVSRCRSGAKRFGSDNALRVFADVAAAYPEWTLEAYIRDWPEIHNRYLRRQHKLDKWDSSQHEEGELPPCGACGDRETDHKDKKCTACSDCTGYEAWVRRGRPMNHGVARRIRENGTRHRKKSKEYGVVAAQLEM